MSYSTSNLLLFNSETELFVCLRSVIFILGDFWNWYSFFNPFLVFFSEFEFRGDWFVKCFIKPMRSTQMSLSGTLNVWATWAKVRENRSFLLYSIYYFRSVFLYFLRRSLNWYFVSFLFFFLFLIWFLWRLVRVVFDSANAFNSDVSEWDVARAENMKYSMWK